MLQHLPGPGPILATLGTTGGAAVALNAVLEAQGPLPSAIAGLLIALTAILWQVAGWLRDERARQSAAAERDE